MIYNNDVKIHEWSQISDNCWERQIRRNGEFRAAIQISQDYVTEQWYIYFTGFTNYCLDKEYLAMYNRFRSFDKAESAMANIDKFLMKLSRLKAFS